MNIIILLTLCGTVLCTPSKLRSLIDDIDGLIKLIPFDKVDPVVDEHLQHDSDFGRVVRYLQGEEWTKLVHEVHIQPEWQDFVKYLNQAGFDIEGFVKSIHDLIKDLQPGTEGKAELNVRSFLDDVETLLPLEDMFYYINDKLETSEDFKLFYYKLASPKSRLLVEHVGDLPEVQRVSNVLIEMGVRVNELVDVLYDFLDWD